MKNALSLRCFLREICGCNFRILGNTNSGSIFEIETAFWSEQARSLLKRKCRSL